MILLNMLTRPHSIHSNSLCRSNPYNRSPQALSYQGQLRMSKAFLLVMCRCNRYNNTQILPMTSSMWLLPTLHSTNHSKIHIACQLLFPRFSWLSLWLSDRSSSSSSHSSPQLCTGGCLGIGCPSTERSSRLRSPKIRTYMMRSYTAALQQPAPL